MQTFFKMDTARIHIPSGVINAKVVAGYRWCFRGLIGLPHLVEGEGLLLRDGHRTHTYGIPYAVDIVFLSMEYQIIQIVENIPTGKMVSMSNAVHTLILAAGQVQALDLKQQMILILS